MIRIVTLMAALAAAVPGLGLAQGNGNGNPHGAGPQGQFCPPGLANRNPPCVPPGQAAQRDPDDHTPDPTPGAVIDADLIHWISDWPDRGLEALPEGLAYALVNNQIVVIDEQTLALVELVRLLQ